MKEKEALVESLKTEVCNLDESIAQSVEEKHELRLAYDEKLRDLAKQLVVLKQQLAQGNAGKILYSKTFTFILSKK